MEKTKIFIQQNPKWQVLEDCILRIASFCNTHPGLAIENCKSLMESIFKTIIVEVENKTEDDLKGDSITQLYKKIRILLRLEERGYAQIIGSFVNSIAEFRNRLGETSHGKDIYTLEENRNTLFADEINFLLYTTDNIAFFLLSYYTLHYPEFAKKRKELVYEDNTQFNFWFDENEPIINVRNIELSPSRVLFDNDEEAYKTCLLEYKEKDFLIEELKISPHFSTTHLIIKKLSQHSYFSESQIKGIWEAFVHNNQVHWIAIDPDVANFCKPIILENKELFEEHQIDQFVAHYN